MKTPYALALIAAASFGTYANAAPVEGPDSVPVLTTSVRYDATQIRDGRSAERLFFRIRMAAENVCQIASHPAGYEIWDERACEKDAVAQAVRAADLPELNRYYFGDSSELVISRS
jgi:UrcA family protein